MSALGKEIAEAVVNAYDSAATSNKVDAAIAAADAAIAPLVEALERIRDACYSVEGSGCSIVVDWIGPSPEKIALAALARIGGDA